MCEHQISPWLVVSDVLSQLFREKISTFPVEHFHIDGNVKNGKKVPVVHEDSNSICPRFAFAGLLPFLPSQE